MAGRVDEHDFAAVALDVVSADVLRNTAGFAARHVGFANGVEQRRFAMIDVTHDRDDGTARHCAGGVLFDRLQLERVFERDDFRFDAEVFRDLESKIGAERLIDGGHDAPLRHQMTHQVIRLDLHFLGELFHGHAFGEREFAGWLRELERGAIP